MSNLARKQINRETLSEKVGNYKILSHDALKGVNTIQPQIISRDSVSSKSVKHNDESSDIES